MARVKKLDHKGWLKARKDEDVWEKLFIAARTLFKS
jgi:hypothetical protein